MLQEPVIDLREISAVVLSDPGATLEVLRLSFSEHPARMEDALAGLPLSAVLDAISRSPVDLSGRLSEVWEHGRRTAVEMCRAAAACPDLLPEQAWMVGLLHELGSLPGLLGWTLPPECQGAHQGSCLAEYWQLPGFLVSALREIEWRRSSSKWLSLLQAAHRRIQSSECGICVPPAPQRSRSRLLQFESSEWKSRRSVRPGVPA